MPHTFEVYDSDGSDRVTIFGSAFSETLSYYAGGGGNLITIDTNYLPAGFNFIGSEGVDVASLRQQHQREFRSVLRARLRW